MNPPTRHWVAWWVLLLCAAPTGAAIALAGLMLAAGLDLLPSSVNLASGPGVFAMIVAAMVGAVGALVIAAAILVVRLAVGSSGGARIAEPLVAVGVAAVTTLAFIGAAGVTPPTFVVSWIVFALPGGLAGLGSLLALATRE